MQKLHVLILQFLPLLFVLIQIVLEVVVHATNSSFTYVTINAARVNNNYKTRHKPRRWFILDNSICCHNKIDNFNSGKTEAFGLPDTLFSNQIVLPFGAISVRLLRSTEAMFLDKTAP